ALQRAWVAQRLGQRARHGAEQGAKAAEFQERATRQLHGLSSLACSSLACSSFATRRSCRCPLETQTVPPCRSTGAPLLVVAIPPASCTRMIPGAMSQAHSAFSQ